MNIFLFVFFAETATVKYDCEWDITSFPPATYQGIAMSEDGSFIVGVDGNSTFFKSIDSGKTVTTKPILEGVGVEVSLDGRYITIAGKDYIYSSDDFGETFRNQSIAGDTAGVGMSADGRFQLISGLRDSTILTSNDWGHTWITSPLKQFDSNGWASVINRKGNYQVAGMNTRYSFISHNYGESFSDLSFDFTPELMEIYQIVISNDMKYQIMAGEGFLATSNNSGLNWKYEMEGTFYGAALNSNGEYLIGVDVNDLQRYYLSSDFGNSWYLGGGNLQDLNDGGLLSYARYSWDAKNIIVSNWNDKNGRIYRGRCGWTLTIVAHIVVAVVAEVYVPPVP